ncbi:MAG: 50S ribosomal protein L24 [Candidatus Nanohaloarchaeota archaeon]|nr:50S ribosomal protein L24 [Candidatus Nanohaloarchaeota archaeon]
MKIVKHATKWSKQWKSSKNPSKQRKYVYNAPLHVKRKMLKAPLSKELKAKLKRNAVVVRKGDKVKIMRGDLKGQVGEVIKVMTKKLRVYVDVAKRKNLKGEEKHIPLHPSNLMILELNLSDKKRFKE